MKKLIAVATLITSTAIPLAQTAMADDDIGCGLGSILFEGKTGKVVKVLGATTNGSSGNQTFGITFGTLGCDGSGKVTSEAKLALFIDGNMDNLARDMAKGEGETLDTLAAVWGIKQTDKLAFNHFAKQHFSDVFQSENVTSTDVFNNLNKLVSNDPLFASYAIKG